MSPYSPSEVSIFQFRFCRNPGNTLYVGFFDFLLVTVGHVISFVQLDIDEYLHIILERRAAVLGAGSWVLVLTRNSSVTPVSCVRKGTAEIAILKTKNFRLTRIKCKDPT